MADVPTEIASHSVREGMVAVRLYGGPWDGKEVGVRDGEARRVAVHGPRDGNHRVWVRHLYERQGGRLVFVRTAVIPVTAWGFATEWDAI